MNELQKTITQLEQEMGKQPCQIMPLSWLLGLGSIFVVEPECAIWTSVAISCNWPLAYVIAALGLAGTGVAS